MSRRLAIRFCIIPLVGLVWLLPIASCSGKQEAGQPVQREAAESGGPASAGQAGTAMDSTPEPDAVRETQESPAPVETAPPSTPASSQPPPAAATPLPSSGAPDSTPPEAPREVAEKAPSTPVEIVAVPATKPGITRVGSEKCKLCHKVQYASWVETAHAKRTPPLDCESCHGPGSEYKTIAIMKDPEKARAAGLVIPEKTFCTENCHAQKWQEDMLQRVHAHKAKAAGS